MHRDVPAEVATPVRAAKAHQVDRPYSCALHDFFPRFTILHRYETFLPRRDTLPRCPDRDTDERATALPRLPPDEAPLPTPCQRYNDSMHTWRSCPHAGSTPVGVGACGSLAVLQRALSDSPSLIEASGTPRGAPSPPSSDHFSLRGESGPSGHFFFFSPK